jgi:hypothetical protein
MEALSASTKRSGWLRRVDAAKGLGLRPKTTQVYVEAANGELVSRASPAGSVISTEQLEDCRVSTVTKKGLAHGLRVDLAAGSRSGAEQSLVLGCADSDDSSLWLACLQNNASFRARLDELRRAANAFDTPDAGFVSAAPAPGEGLGAEAVDADADDAERQRYAQVLQLTVEQALDPTVLSATFRSSLQQADKHTLKERHQELLAAKRYFERQHRGQREARRSQRVGVSGGGDSTAPVSPGVTQSSLSSSGWAGSTIPEHPALRGTPPPAPAPAPTSAPATAAAATSNPPAGATLVGTNPAVAEARARAMAAGEGASDGGPASALSITRDQRAKRAAFPAREWSASDVRSWALSVVAGGLGSPAVALIAVADALEVQQVDGEALEAIPSYEDLQQIISAGMSAQTTHQQPGAFGATAGPVLKLWRRLQALRQDGIDAFECNREAAAMAVLQEVTHDTTRLEQQLTSLRAMMTEEQERSQQMLLELSSLKNTTMQVAAAASAAADGSRSSSESDDDWGAEAAAAAGIHPSHSYLSASASALAPQPASTGASSAYSSDELSSPTARSDWASEDGEGEEGRDEFELEEGRHEQVLSPGSDAHASSSHSQGGHEQPTSSREMERLMADGTKRLKDPIAINELLLQSLSFGDELDDARIALQARYAELVREQALSEAGGVKDLSQY